MRACKSFAFGIAVGVTVSTATFALASQEVECTDTRTFDSEQYWFWEGYLGVTDIKKSSGEISGRLTLDPSICFRVEADTLDDPTARTRGYKEAVSQWFLRIPEAEDRWNEPDVVRAREAFARLTGRHFERRTDLANWSRENSNYLLFSEEEGHLIVVEEAKKSGRPVAQAALKIPAAEYWSLEGQGAIRESYDEGDHLILWVWIPPEGEQLVQVAKSELEDRSSKEEGYRHALSLLILDGVGLEGLSEESVEKFMTRLESLTGESHSTPAEWIEWWKRNKDDLVLSSDGRRLTVRSKVQ